VEQVKRIRRVYLDTNVLINLVEGEQGAENAFEAPVRRYEEEGAEFVTSELTLAEVLVLPIRTGNETLIGLYEALFERFVMPLPISREVLYLTAKLRAETASQRMPDAIHVATAMLAQADVFVTGDKGIKNLPESIALHLI
jgi:predicted nucleic acid-binding protein